MAKRGCTSAAQLTRPGRGASGCDDRTRIDDSQRLFLVADGSGPTYGGIYAPMGLERGLEVLASALDPARHAEHVCDEGCVQKAFASANGAMWALHEAFTARFESELAVTPDDRLQASLRAWKQIAREHLGRELETFAHSGGSVTALLLAGDRAHVGQVGLCRAYRCRRGRVELLLRDQGIEKPEGLDDAFSHGIASVLLGLQPTVPVETRALAFEPGDRFVLCSDGVWSLANDVALAAACRHDRADDIVAELSAVVKDNEDDVAIVAVVMG